MLKLRNRGFKKYVLTKLFQHITYSRRDKLLNTELFFLMFVNHLLLEAKRRIILEGEAMFSLSQGVEATSSPLVLIPLSSKILSTTNNNNNTSAREDTRILGHHLEITSTGGSSSIRQATWRFILKIWQNAENIFYNMNLSFFSESPKNDQYEAESMFGPSWEYAKVKKPMDMLFDESLTKFSCKSERFAKLAEDLNICIVLENEHSIKKLLVA